MEWDSWPNEGYPCQECGKRFECSEDCHMRQNDAPQKEYCSECRAEKPYHRTSPRCSQLRRLDGTE